jgi:hypothetical protein
MKSTTGFWVAVVFGATLWGQQAPATTPSAAQVDSPSEIEKLKNSCGFSLKGIEGCADELFTGHPFHIAVGSIAPQNGFGGGLAYVGGKNTDNWRISWNGDAIASNNASWRAGFYLTMIHTPTGAITVSKGTKGFKPNLSDLPEHTVITLYAQTISLNKLTYFGLGSNSQEANRSFYGMRETIVGGNGVKYLSQKWKLSMFGEANGRFVSLRPSMGQPSPSIEQLYSEATAPGLTTQPGTLQLGEGLRLTPVLGNDIVRLNYRATYQQYVTPGSSYSFQRVTFDLGHQFAIRPKTTRVLTARSGNGPDDCSLDASAKNAQCPPVTRDLEGSFGLRALNILSFAPQGDAVPFYFQPTLGGSDINGNASLSSYQDYRFRAPDLLLFQESFEHSLGRLPLGIMLTADQGRLGTTAGDLRSSPWLHSFAAGLTLRAGGFPEISFLFAFGGHEGTHTIASVNTSLLGGSARPPLF